MRERRLLHTGEWLWSCCGLYTTGVAALCCIIKSHIHALSFFFFLPVSLYQSRSQTWTSMNRGQRGEKVEVLVCSRDSLSHWLAFSHTQAWKRKRNRKKHHHEWSLKGWTQTDFLSLHHRLTGPHGSFGYWWLVWETMF